MRRTRGTVFLALAYLTALAAPLRSGWTCPDGTSCVVSRPEQFVCAGNQCATEKSCCVKEHPTACKHGALPETTSRDDGARIQSPDHCRYSVTEPPQLVAQIGYSTVLVDLGDSLPVSGLSPYCAVARGAVRFPAFTLGYRPPPLLDCGPSRAPPSC